MDARLPNELRARARALGFAWVGVCGAAPSSGAIEAYRTWIAAGMHGEMSYMARPDRVARALDPRLSLEGARTLLMVGSPYPCAAARPDIGSDPSRGLVARYARGEDYHASIHARLEVLAAWLADRLAARFEHRAMVDYRPLLERDAAQRAGLGFIGRNTMLIHPRHGSWSFLGALLLDVDRQTLCSSLGLRRNAASDAPPDAPRDDPQSGAANPCGRCTRCLDACPTNAFPREYVLDARRCISYLTIELKGPIPTKLRPLVGNRIFGCDVCNDVCPYNRRFSSRAADALFVPRDDLLAPRLVALLALDDAGFARRFRGTPIERAKRSGLLRNVCVALGNWGSPSAIPALSRALADHEPLVRGHAAWALGQIVSHESKQVLGSARSTERDPWAIEEIAQALNRIR